MSVLSDHGMSVRGTIIKHDHHPIRDNQRINTDENSFAYETSISHGTCCYGMA